MCSRVPVIDPYQFYSMIIRIDNMENQIKELSSKVDQILEGLALAPPSKLQPEGGVEYQKALTHFKDQQFPPKTSI